jgi:HlyD family secretion protein
MKKKIVWIFVTLILLGVSASYFYVSQSQSPSTTGARTIVEVQKGNIIEKALAVGTIQPEFQVEVKSKVSGVVKRIYAEPGTYVKAGDPLIEVQPDPTPLELAEAKRNLELSEIQIQTLTSSLERQSQLKERGMISQNDYEETLRIFNDAMVRLQMNRERLALLESGKVTIGGIHIESVIKAPISGFVLDKMVNIGDPVVPLTSYQAGTVLMNMADMSNLMFKGNVDEIDVGKMKEGMDVELKIGAIPGVIVQGKVSKISLKAKTVDNTTVFPVEIVITDDAGVTLRAGYSANADVIIKKLEDVLVIPERLITFRDNKAFVEILIDEIAGTTSEKEIQTGSGDAIIIEVTDGLNVGEKVLEKPLRSLTL